MPVIYEAPPYPATTFLAEDIFARRTQPPADLSAMDGYAVCGKGPWNMIGESRAGSPFKGTLISGECTRISTGAHMPNGADRVVIQENISRNGQVISLADPNTYPSQGANVRIRGFDFVEGDALLGRGSKMGPAQIALARSGGHDNWPCFRPPSVTVLETGDELSALASDCSEYQIPSSNGAMIAAMLQPLVPNIDLPAPIADDRVTLSNLFQSITSDITIISGGASVGDHDHVKAALLDSGATIEFWKAAIKPGKPLLVATRPTAAGHQLIIGLPGNPVSSFVTAFLFAVPLVRAAMGSSAPLPSGVLQPLAEALPPTGNRREFLRGVLTADGVEMARSQDSSALRALSEANCLIDRPAGSPAANAGEMVSIYHL